MITSKPTRVAVVGASGYAGEELVRLLLAHPIAKLAEVTSRQYAGRSLAEVFPRFAHNEQAQTIKFSEADAKRLAETSDLVFLALPHGVSGEVAASLLELNLPVIDLSADFRLRNAKVYQEYYGADHPAPKLLNSAVYGLPEIYREQIRAARLVACPGCYPTSILLPLLPLVRAKLIDPQRILVSSLSGVTGAGRKVEADYLFAECNESIRAYGVSKHRHLSEMEQELSLAAGETVTIQFTPHLVPVNRGIISTIYVEPRRGEDIGAAYEKAYAEEPFIRLRQDRLPDTKDVAGTNFLDLAWRSDHRTKRVVIVSAMDNLTKGTSGQAMQCFNLMRGYAETAGLI